jgi:hypothetical protein
MDLQLLPVVSGHLKRGKNPLDPPLKNQKPPSQPNFSKGLRFEGLLVFWIGLSDPIKKWERATPVSPLVPKLQAQKDRKTALFVLFPHKRHPLTVEIFEGSPIRKIVGVLDRAQ